MNIFITGSTTGIGLELARLYLKEGHRVAISGRDLSKLPVDFKGQFSNASYYELDVLDKNKLSFAIKDFAKGQIDIVIANAGISMGVKSRLPQFDRWREVIDTNIHGVINTFEPAIELMSQKHNGQLVALSSVAGFMGLPGAGAYSGSKAAVRTFCESLAIDLKREGIDVSIICPGFIDTPLTRKNHHPMPWLMSAENGALIIKKAIERKKVLYLFPWPMRILTCILSRMPRSLYRFIMTVRIFNFSKE